MIITHLSYVRTIWTSNFFVLFLFLSLCYQPSFAQLYFNHTFTYKDTINASPTHDLEIEYASIFEINGLVTNVGESINEIDVRANFTYVKMDSSLGLHHEYVEMVFKCLKQHYETIMGKGPYYIKIELDSAGLINQFNSVRGVEVEKRIISLLTDCGFANTSYSYKYMKFDEILLVFRRSQRKIGEVQFSKSIELNLKEDESKATKKERKNCSFFGKK